RITAHDHARAVRLFVRDVSRNASHSFAHIGHGEFFGDDCAPARSPEFDGRVHDGCADNGTSVSCVSGGNGFIETSMIRGASPVTSKPGLKFARSLITLDTLINYTGTEVL